MATPTDPFRLDGKVAVVTGSGRGIGAAIALALGHRGAKVVVNYAHSAGPAADIVRAIQAAGSEAIAVQADVSDVAQTARLMDAAVARFGRLDIVSSNSGVVSFGHLKDVTTEEYDRVFGVNTRGQFFVAKEAYKRLSEGGRIVLTSSNTASVKGVPNHTVYSGSKGAIESFVRCLVSPSFIRPLTAYVELRSTGSVVWLTRGWAFRLSTVATRGSRSTLLRLAPSRPTCSRLCRASTSLTGPTTPSRWSTM